MHENAATCAIHGLILYGSQGRSLHPPMTAESVLCDQDTIETVLSHADLDPTSFTLVSMVSHSWWRVCRTCPLLILRAAAGARCPSNETCVRLLALPRVEIPSAATSFEMVLTATGGVAAWRHRLTCRAKSQASIEQTFGPDWRELRQLLQLKPEPARGMKRRRPLWYSGGGLRMRRSVCG